MAYFGIIVHQPVSYVANEWGKKYTYVDDTQNLDVYILLILNFLNDGIWLFFKGHLLTCCAAFSGYLKCDVANLHLMLKL